VSVYLGPDAARWRPESFSDVVVAAEDGLIDETHWVELKQELQRRSAASNKEVARDLASLAVDGGCLVIGVEDDDGKAGAVSGTDLNGLAERVDSIARSAVAPPLLTRSTQLRKDANSGEGCLLVEVPMSAYAPHMVDGRYWGRHDRGKYPLPDEEVRRIIADRHSSAADAGRALDALFERQPTPVNSKRMFAVLAPVAGPPHALDDQLYASGVIPWLAAHEAAADDLGSDPALRDFAIPSLTGGASLRPLVGGVALTTYSPDSTHEASLLELQVSDDGTVAYIAGRVAESRDGGKWVWAAIPVALLHRLIRITRQLADEAMPYQGSWHAAVLIRGTQGALAGDCRDTDPFWQRRLTPYPEESYVGSTTTTTLELSEAPSRIVRRLLIPFLRALQVDQRYAHLVEQ
jgi:hypothetical protein